MLRCNKIFSSKNFQLKVLLVLFLFSFSNSWGQATIPVSRTGWGTTPTGWSDNQGTSPTYASDICSGSGASSGRLDNAGENFVVFYDIGAANLSFCVKGNTGSGAFSGTFLLQESTDGITWSAGQNVPVTTSAVTQNLTLSCTSRYIRFYFSVQTNGNVQLDNVSITQGVCTTCTAPSTTITPTTQTLCAGAVTTISVSSTATIPSYTWQASANGSSGWAAVASNTPVGASYSGQGTGTLSITAGSTYYYRCLVAENATCTATSGTSTLVVNSSPTITSQPTDKIICSGTNASFIVGASGSPLTYQWQENSGSGFVNITNGGVYSGATAASLLLTAPPVGMSTYSYQCVVSVASCSSVTTTAVSLTVNATPAAPPAPIPVSNPACTNGTLSAASSTVAGVTWYWQGTNAAGTSTTNPTSSTYTFASTGTYYVRALNSSGTCWSSSASVFVTVNTPVTIVSGATNKGVCTGVNTTMDITGAAATKQWYVSTDNGVTFNPVTATAVYTAGINTNALSITNAPASYNGYQYYCTSSVAGCPTLTSSIGVLTVTQTPAAPPTPTALANPACSGTALIAMTSTVAGVTWYWQGTTSLGTSTTNPTTLNDNITTSGTYYVRARTDGSSCLSAQSSTVVTINNPPNVLTNPIDKSVCVGNNTTFSVAASGTGLSYIWQVNTGSGFTNLTNVAPYSNVTTAIMTITGITAGMNGYLYQCVVNGASPCAAATSTIATLVITAAGTPVTPASLPLNSAIACNAFNLSWTNGSGSNRLVVVSAAPVAGTPVNGTSYAANSTFGSGGIIAAGEFVVYKGIGSSVFITGLAASTTYYYKIFEFNGCSVNYLTSGIIPNGNVTTTNCSSTPGVTGVYINACGGGCGYEGNNEMIWGVTGSYGLNVNNNGPILDYIGTTQITTYGLNATAINALNVATGSCTNTVFVDPNTLGYIPANAKFLIANSCMCMPSAYDLSGLCNSGPIYVVFGTGPSWACNTSGGIFGNTNSGGVKDFDLDFTPWGVPIVPSYSFTAGSLSPSDGAAITLNPAGGAATGYFNNGCAVPFTILPIDLIDFYATQNGSKNDLIWKVASEKNISQYIIEKSEDGLYFNEMTRLNSIVTEGEALTYMIEDESPYSDITYYRLSTLENSGKINHHKIIDIDRTNKNWESLLYQNDNNLILEFKNAVPKNSSVSLYDLSGKLLVDETIKDSQTKINIQNFSEGIYFLRLSTPYKTENYKLIIQK